MTRIGANHFSTDADLRLNGWNCAPVDHASRPLVEHYIHRRFLEEYQANLCHFLPELICLTDQHGIYAAVGYSSALNRELYLEQYLSSPVEVILQRTAGVVARRDSLNEVGNLASSSPGGARAIILMLTRHFYYQNTEWVVFTGVPSLLNTFSRLGILTHALGEADPELLTDRATDWGSYYASHPQVVAVSVRDSFDRLTQNPVFARIMKRMPVLGLDDRRLA